MNLSNYLKMKEAFSIYLQAKGFTHKSIQSMLVIFHQYHQWVDREHLALTEVRYHDLLLFMSHCQKTGKAQRTIGHYLTTIRHFYDHLISASVITTNPATGIKVKGIRKKVLYHILSSHERHQLYNSYEASMARQRRDKVILGLLVYQGVRTEELAKLETGHIHLREGKIEIPGGRKSNGRTLPLEPHQIMDLYDYVLNVRNELMRMPPKRKVQSTTTEQLFIGAGGHCSSMSNFIHPLMITLRAQNRHVHNAKQLRASVITKWLKQHNLREAQYLAGHRYISSTESYLQNDLEGLQEEIQQYHPLG